MSTMFDKLNALKRVIINLMNASHQSWTPKAIDESTSWEKIFKACRKLTSDMYGDFREDPYILPELILARLEPVIFEIYLDLEKSGCYQNSQIWKYISEIQNILSEAVERGAIDDECCSLEQLENAGVRVSDLAKEYVWRSVITEQNYDPNSEDVRADLI